MLANFTDQTTACPHCRGAGYFVEGPAGQRSIVNCIFCNGTGLKSVRVSEGGK